MLCIRIMHNISYYYKYKIALTDNKYPNTTPTPNK